MKKLLILLLSAAVFSASAQDAPQPELHLEKNKMAKGEAVITTVVGGLLMGTGLGFAGWGTERIINGNTPFGGTMIGTRGLLLGTGMTMTILGGRRIHVLGLEIGGKKKKKKQ